LTKFNLSMRELDIDDYDGRLQAFIKHKLLATYLPELIYRVGRKWEGISYVDGFAGPWGSNDPDHRDTSFGLAVDLLAEHRRGLQEEHGDDFLPRALLIERDPRAFAKLEEFAERRNRPDFPVTAAKGELEDNLQLIQKFLAEGGEKSFRFILLDPKGWNGLGLNKIAPILRDRSCEVLVNVMSRHIVRFIEQGDRADSYEKFFGSRESLDLIKGTPPKLRRDAAVHEYCKSLKRLGGFRYVAQCVVLRPETDEVLYHLVFGTNHPRGVEVFKQAELAAMKLQEDVRRQHKRETREQRTGQTELSLGGTSSLVLDLRERYLGQAMMAVNRLVRTHTEISYEQVFCEFMAFPMVSKKDLDSHLELSDDFELHLVQEGARKPNVEREDQVSWKGCP